MKLYFLNSRNKSSLVEDNVSPDNVLQKIYADVAKRNPHFIIYYVREWILNGRTFYDVGSHTEFYVMTDEDAEGLNAEKRRV